MRCWRSRRWSYSPSSRRLPAAATRHGALAVRDGEPVPVARLEPLALALEQLAELVEQLGRRVFGGAREAVSLEHKRGFEEIGDLAGGDGHDERAALGVELEQALGLELQERLAHGRAGDGQLLRDRAFAQPRIARALATIPL
jgi:hypothetical protein